MKTSTAIWKSVGILVGAVIAIVALARGSLMTALLLIAVSAWGLWMLYPGKGAGSHKRRALRSLPAEKAGEPRKKQPVNPPQETFEVPIVEASHLEKLLLLHVNQRITAALQAAYPEAHWAWQTPDPQVLVEQGGIGHITISGVPDFEQADVRIDQRANLECNLVKIVPLPKGVVSAAQEAALPTPKVVADPKIWYETRGRKVLENVMADLNSRGHTSLTLQENGEIATSESSGKPQVLPQRLTAFPERAAWSDLAQVLEGEGLAAAVDEQGIRLSW